MVNFVKNNQRLQVLTDKGWSDFDGVLEKGIQHTLCIETDAGEICATKDHKFYMPDLTTKEAGDLIPGDLLHGLNGNATVLTITIGETETVYDLRNVAKGNRFYANDTLISNCEFIMYDETLIDSIFLSSMRGADPVLKRGAVRWYKNIDPKSTYIIALDPSLGTGGDPAAIQIYEAPSMIQVGEWCHNKTPIPQQVKILVEICKYLEEYVGSQNIYYSVENNSIGEASLISIADVGEENIPGVFLSEPRRAGHVRSFRKGFNTTQKSKLTACAKLKTLIETEKMTVNSKMFISELKNFVASGGSYAAKLGQSDDLVMSTILAIRMATELKNYVPELDNQIRDSNDYNLQPMPFVIV